MRLPILAALTAVLALAAPSAQAQRPVVLELFTSQGCSSCPPADALLRELAGRTGDVLPLAFHVTYWNGLGWRDPFSLDLATDRQRDYDTALGSETYTPQLVVDGRADVVGSDRASVLAAIREAQTSHGADVAVSVRPDGRDVVIDVGRGAGPGRVLVVGYDPQRITAVGRGENGGRTLTEANIVRSLADAGGWTGAAVQLRAPRPAGESMAVLLQGSDHRILGAGREAADAH